jgi:hypothetical protein
MASPLGILMMNPMVTHFVQNDANQASKKIHHLANLTIPQNHRVVDLQPAFQVRQTICQAVPFFGGLLSMRFVK